MTRPPFGHCLYLVGESGCPNRHHPFFTPRSLKNICRTHTFKIRVWVYSFQIRKKRNSFLNPLKALLSRGWEIWGFPFLFGSSFLLPAPPPFFLTSPATFLGFQFGKYNCLNVCSLKPFSLFKRNTRKRFGNGYVLGTRWMLLKVSLVIVCSGPLGNKDRDWVWMKGLANKLGIL